MLLYKMVAAGFVVVDGAVVVGPPTEAVASEEVAAPKLSQDELSRFATLLKELQTLEDAQCPSVPVISGAISDTPKHWHFRRWKNDVIEDSYFSRAESQYIETAFHAYLSGSGPRKIYFYSGQDGTDVYEINFQPLRSDLGQLSAIQDQNDWSDADQRKHLQVFNRVLLNNRSHPNDPESWHFTYTNIRTGKDQKSSPSRFCLAQFVHPTI